MGRGKLLVFAFLALVVLVAGCVNLPIEEDTWTQKYVLKGDGGIDSIATYEGDLASNADEWAADCSAKFKIPLQSGIALMEGMMDLGYSEGYGDTGMSEEEKQQMEELLDIMKDIVSSMRCNFRKSGSRGTLTLTSHLSYHNIQRMEDLQEELTEMMGTSASYSSGDQTSVTTTNGKIHTILPISTGDLSSLTGTTTYIGMDELIIEVEGDVESISPSGYEQVGNAYVYRNPRNIEKVEVVYAGGGLPLVPLVIGAVIIVIAIVLIMVVAYRRGYKL